MIITPWADRVGQTAAVPRVLGGRIMAGDILYFLHRHVRVVLPATVITTALGIVVLAAELHPF